MFGSLKKKKSLLEPRVIDDIYNDVKLWMVNELTNIPPKQVDGKQVNPLLNFCTYDLHTLVTQKGFAHMRMMLAGEGTTQTVMLRLKNLVVDLYIKYGDDLIDELRLRVYNAISNMYGLDFNIEDTLDLNNTFWLHPFCVKMYTELKLGK